MDETYLRIAVRYIGRNPVAAGLFEYSEQWPWSSARAHVYAESGHLANVRRTLEIVESWKGCFEDYSEPVCDQDLMEKHSCMGKPLGDSKSVKSLETINGRRFRALKPGPKATIVN